MYSVGLYTLGCKVSQYETEAVGEAFSERGFLVCDFTEPCDVYVINTCTVTRESDRKSRQFIRRALKANPRAVVIVIGCYSQRAPEEVAAIEGVSAVIGTECKMSAPDIAERMLSEISRGGVPEKYIRTTDVTKATFEPMTVKRAPRTRAYVKIEDGCESKCTYCAISGARGRVRSKPREEVVSEVEALYASGTREIVLTGIETGSYGRDFLEKYDLADLILELDSRGSCERLRLGSLAPELINKSFVARVKNAKILCPHFHLSMQSGSNAVLNRMKRRYSREMARAVIDDIRANIEGATFTTDLMVGFPSETEEDFLETVDFVRTARLLDAHVFAYSRREGTPAAYYDGQIPEDVKRDRSERLIRVKNEVRGELLEEIVRDGSDLLAIAEAKNSHGVWSAHTAGFVEVSFECDAEISGEVVKLRPVVQKNGVIHCKLIEKI